MLLFYVERQPLSCFNRHELPGSVQILLLGLRQEEGFVVVPYGQTSGQVTLVPWSYLQASC